MGAPAAADQSEKTSNFEWLDAPLLGAGLVAALWGPGGLDLLVDYDSARDLGRATALLNGRLPVDGPAVSPLGISLSPAYYLLLAPFLLLPGPGGALAAFRLAMFAATVLVQRLARRVLPRPLAALAALLYGTSAATVATWSQLTHSAFAPPLALGALLCAERAVRRRSSGAWLAAVALACLALQMHLVWGVALLAVALHALRERLHLPLRTALLSFALFSVSWAPFVGSSSARARLATEGLRWVADSVARSTLLEPLLALFLVTVRPDLWRTARGRGQLSILGAVYGLHLLVASEASVLEWRFLDRAPSLRAYDAVPLASPATELVRGFGLLVARQAPPLPEVLAVLAVLAFLLAVGVVVLARLARDSRSIVVSLALASAALAGCEGLAVLATRTGLMDRYLSPLVPIAAILVVLGASRIGQLAAARLRRPAVAASAGLVGLALSAQTPGDWPRVGVPIAAAVAAGPAGLVAAAAGGSVLVARAPRVDFGLSGLLGGRALEQGLQELGASSDVVHGGDGRTFLRAESAGIWAVPASSSAGPGAAGQHWRLEKSSAAHDRAARPVPGTRFAIVPFTPAVQPVDVVFQRPGLADFRASLPMTDLATRLPMPGPPPPEPLYVAMDSLRVVAVRRAPVDPALDHVCVLVSRLAGVSGAGLGCELALSLGGRALVPVGGYAAGVGWRVFRVGPQLAAERLELTLSGCALDALDIIDVPAPGPLEPANEVACREVAF